MLVWVICAEYSSSRVEYLDADGAHAGTTAAVGDAEGLVQVQVAHIRANVAW